MEYKVQYMLGQDVYSEGKLYMATILLNVPSVQEWSAVTVAHVSDAKRSLIVINVKSMEMQQMLKVILLKFYVSTFKIT